MSHWDEFGHVPVEEDDVIIQKTWNMVYDIEVSPKLKSLTVEGKLTFKNDGTDRHIKVYNFWVKKGEVNVGTPEEPWQGTFRITLLGTNREKYFAFDRTIEAGNKNLVVTGKMNMYGIPRSPRSFLR